MTASASSRLWDLGAADPEMALIERILLSCGERVYYAAVQTTKGPSQVHPGNAYRAEGAVPIYPGRPGLLAGEHETLGSFDYFPHADQVILVECGFREGHACQPGRVPVYLDPQAGYVHMCSSSMEEWAYDVVVSRIDHHRPGDPGYGRPPEEYWGASSLGQVCHLLGYDPECGFRSDLLMVAAADHCLEAAYRGLCPGVDPEELMRWRAESRAAHQKRPVEVILLEVRTASLKLREAVRCRNCGESGTAVRCTCHGEPSGWCPDNLYQGEYESYTCPDCQGKGSREVADLRGQHIPELPEAACREGIPYLAEIQDPDGRVKVVLGAANPGLTRRFLAGELVPGLTGLYGDPARGFAGGYLP